jgi:hypothetical protein
MADRQKLAQRNHSFDNAQFWHRVQDERESPRVVKLCCFGERWCLNTPIHERVFKYHGQIRGDMGIIFRDRVHEKLRIGKCAWIVNCCWR